MVVLVGLPGCGKSTWAAKQKLPVLSSDAIRAVLADDERDQSIHKRVFATIRYLLRHRIQIGRPVTCIDATHLTPWERRPYLKLAGCRVEAVFFNVPLATCKKRNRGRARVVPDEVLERMAEKLVKPTRAEGFARVTVVPPKRQGTSQPKRGRKQ